MKPNQEVLEKLKKILTLANDAGAQPGEVEAAMAKAKEIAMRHQIELASVDLHGTDEEKACGIEVQRVNVKFRSQRPQKYHRFICALFSKIFGVTTVQTWQQYVFIGEAVDVAICQALFPWLEDVFYSTYNKAANAGIITRCAASKNGIYSGLYRGILDANRREEAKLSTEDKSKWALVVVNKEALVQQRVAQEFPTLTKSRNRALSSDAVARMHGYQKGRQINLHNQVGGSNAAGRLN